MEKSWIEVLKKKKGLFPPAGVELQTEKVASVV